EEVKPLPAQSPVSPQAGGQIWEHGHLRASRHGHPPESAIRGHLAVVDILPIGRFERGESAILGHLLSRSGGDRLFPDLPCTAAVGAKINEFAVSRPARHYVAARFGSEPPWSAAV